jgi:serine phosphatase RsbU (regulator of sigma subunit)
MGILNQAQYTDTVIALDQGDILTLFTDGVTEQENEAGDEFSLSRLEQVIVSREAEPAAALVARVTEAVSAFAGAKEQADDLTLVVVKVR